MMFDGYGLAVALLAISAVLIIGEMLLPTQGVLGLAGTVAVVSAVVICGRQNAWAAIGLVALLLLASPLIWMVGVRIWPHTYTGRRMILPPVAPPQRASAVCVGQTGVSVSELRPTGVCEFDGIRIEARSELGIVPAGTPVTVVAIVNSRPTVRIVA
jgi:membrane-bound serine protease (ClpP class)